jgi:hypothetical protein
MRWLVAIVLVSTFGTAFADDGEHWGLDLLDGTFGFERMPALQAPVTATRSTVPRPTSSPSVTLTTGGLDFIGWYRHWEVGYGVQGLGAPGRCGENGFEGGGIFGYVLGGSLVGARLELLAGVRSLKVSCPVEISAMEGYVRPRVVVGIHPRVDNGWLYLAAYAGTDLLPRAGFVAGGYVAIQVGRW